MGELKVFGVVVYVGVVMVVLGIVVVVVLSVKTSATFMTVVLLLKLWTVTLGAAAVFNLLLNTKNTSLVLSFIE